MTLQWRGSEAGALGVAGAGAAVAVACGVETVLQGEHYRAAGGKVLLHQLHGIVIHQDIVVECIEKILRLEGDAESAVEESLIDLGVDLPGIVAHFHVVFQ